MRNLITDIEGLRVGHAHDTGSASGVTAIIIDTETSRPCYPRRRARLARYDASRARDDGPRRQRGGAVRWLTVRPRRGRRRLQLPARPGFGLRIGPVIIPVAVQAITFDLINGGNKDWGRKPPYWDLGWQAAERRPMATSRSARSAAAMARRR